MRWLAIIPLAALLVALITPLAGAEPVSDDLICDQVRMKLVSDRDVRGGAIEVTVVEGVVTLKGTVRTEKAKRKAESLSKSQKGVNKVVNELDVKPQQ
jgi:osmotically-inducible protein OsmY